MSKRARVRCNCSNRRLLIGSDDLYECGHSGGNLIDFFAGRLLVVGLDVIDVFRTEPERFPTFKRITDWCVCNEGSMSLSSSEAAVWIEEIRALKKLDSSDDGMNTEQLEIWNDLRAGEIMRYAEQNETPPSVFERLLDAEALCRASIRTGNPIEFY